jgi:hypothetical protein
VKRAVLPPKLHPSVHVVLAAILTVAGLSGLVLLGLWRDHMEARRCELRSVTHSPTPSGDGLRVISGPPPLSGGSDITFSISTGDTSRRYYDGCNWTTCDARGNCSMTLASCIGPQWTVTP